MMLRITFILLLASGAIACAAEPPRTAPAVTAKPAVQTGTPVKSSLEQREIRAQLSPRRFTTLAAEVGAKVRKLPVPEGAAFRQGQVLVQFDCSLPQAQLDRAKASLAAATKTFTANQRLAELNSIGKVELDVSEAEVMKTRAEVSAMQVMLSKCTIAAPFSGRVSEQKIREQQFAQPGQALLEIIDDSVLELEFIVPSRWLAWLSNGYPFQVAIDETGKSYPAKVTRIAAKVDPVSQSVKLNAAIEGKFAELISGMSGRVNLTPPAGK